MQSAAASLRSIAASAGVLHSTSAYFSKHPPVQMTDDEGYRCVEQFICGERQS
jgi:myo-inositol-1-phosphate synthase